MCCLLQNKLLLYFSVVYSCVAKFNKITVYIILCENNIRLLFDYANNVHWILYNEWFRTTNFLVTGKSLKSYYTSSLGFFFSSSLLGSSAALLTENIYID